MSSNAGVGGVGYVRHQTSEQEMMAFDALPANVRAALRDAAREWPAVDVLRRIRSGTPANAIITRISDYERTLA